MPGAARSTHCARDAVSQRGFPAERPRRSGARDRLRRRPCRSGRHAGKGGRRLMGRTRRSGLPARQSHLAHAGRRGRRGLCGVRRILPSGTKDVTRFIDPGILHWWSELMELPSLRDRWHNRRQLRTTGAGGDRFSRGGRCGMEPSGGPRRRARAERCDRRSAMMQAILTAHADPDQPGAHSGQSTRRLPGIPVTSCSQSWCTTRTAAVPSVLY